MLAVPEDMPEIRPDAFTVAVPGAVLVHVPPDVALAKVVVAPSHIGTTPINAAGDAFIVTVAVRVHPVDVVYKITEVPADMPVTMPLVLPTVQLPDPLPHKPPVVASVSVVLAPVHTLKVPTMVAGKAFTVTIAVERHAAAPTV